MELPVEQSITPVVPFGHAMRKLYFSFAEGYTNLNHGSYGCFPTIVRARQREVQALIEERPDPFIRKVLPGLLDQSRAAIGPLLGVPKEEIVFIPNATTALNTVLRNLVYQEGDIILYFSTIYDACEKTIEYVCETTPAQSVRIPLEYPIEDYEIVRRFRDMVQGLSKRGKKVKIAMFDTVLTFPGVRMPWETLVTACKDLKVLSLVDGAHGIGHIDLRMLGEVGPDFFTSNCYKWLYAPRGCAIFHVPARNQHLIRSPLPTSHGFRPLPRSTDGTSSPLAKDSRDTFGDMFAWVATIDSTPYVCVPEALQFRDEVCGGEDSVRRYCQHIAQAGAKRIAEILDTEVMENKTHTLQKCCFAMVRLPLRLGSKISPGLEITASQQHDETGAHIVKEATHDIKDAPAIVKWIMDRIVDEFDTFIPARLHAGAIWIRLSGQIYLDIKDFEWAGYLLKDLCQRVDRMDKFEKGLEN